MAVYSSENLASLPEEIVQIILSFVQEEGETPFFSNLKRRPSYRRRFLFVVLTVAGLGYSVGVIYGIVHGAS